MYSSPETKPCGKPASGHDSITMCLQLANPVGVPSQIGEFAVSARSAGDQRESAAIAAMPASRSGTSTCTWVPETYWCAAAWRSIAAISRYRGFGVIVPATSPPIGGSPVPATRIPCASAAAAARARKSARERSASAPVVHTGVAVSIWLQKNSRSARRSSSASDQRSAAARSLGSPVELSRSRYSSSTPNVRGSGCPAALMHCSVSTGWGETTVGGGDAPVDGVALPCSRSTRMTQAARPYSPRAPRRLMVSMRINAQP